MQLLCCNTPTVNSLAPDAPLPMIHSNPGDSQVNERGSGRFRYWWAGSLPYDSAGSMEGPCLKPIGQDPIPRLPVASGGEGDGKGDSPSRTAVPGEGGTGRTPPSLVVSAVGSEAKEPISPVPSWEGDGTEPSSETDRRPLLQRSRHSDTGQDPPVAPAIRVGGTEPTDEPPLAPAIRARGCTLNIPISHSVNRPHQVQQKIQKIEENIRQAKLKANIDAPGKVTELSRIRTTLQEHRTALRNDLTQVRVIRTEMTERAHQQKRVMGESRPHTSPVETTSHERQPHYTPAYCSHKRKRRSTSYSPAKRPRTKAVKGRETVTRADRIPKSCNDPNTLVGSYPPT